MPPSVVRSFGTWLCTIVYLGTRRSCCCRQVGRPRLINKPEVRFRRHYPPPFALKGAVPCNLRDSARQPFVLHLLSSPLLFSPRHLKEGQDQLCSPEFTSVLDTFPLVISRLRALHSTSITCPVNLELPPLSTTSPFPPVPANFFPRQSSFCIVEDVVVCTEPTGQLGPVRGHSCGHHL